MPTKKQSLGKVLTLKRRVKDDLPLHFPKRKNK
jgi:hypothetical protein